MVGTIAAPSTSISPSSSGSIGSCRLVTKLICTLAAIVVLRVKCSVRCIQTHGLVSAARRGLVPGMIEHHAIPHAFASNVLHGPGPAVRRLLPARSRPGRAGRGAGLGLLLVHRAPFPA